MQRLLEGELSQASLQEQMAHVREVAEELECYTAAAVTDARARGMDWNGVGASVFVAPVTARTRWRTAVVEELFRRRAARSANAAAEAPAPAIPEGRPTRDRAARSLASALSFLLRHAALSVKELAERTDLSPSYVSRILAGDRVPTWSTLVQLVRALGGNAADLRAMWEGAQGLARPPRPGREEAVERFGAALRGAYLAIGCPPFERVSEVTDGVVGPDIVEGALLGKVVPCWETTSALLRALQAQPCDVRGLWDDVNYSFLVCLQAPEPAPSESLTTRAVERLRPPFGPGPLHP
ncbi:helix-turn-helix transcriptional regulator [Streptomyces xanthochromogenes]|uniref:helix-turn-helix domain-containing protein n=1 Tax=Streptomyces xanthochromogenes TaxID=67384 RepID=UPI00344215A4